MSQALTIINHSRPHQTFRVGYDMPALDIRAGEEFQASHYAAARARLMGKPPVQPKPQLMPMAAEVLPDDTEVLNMLAPCSWRFLVRLASIRTAVPSDDMFSRSRKPPLVAARTYAMSLIYQHTQLSMPAVAKIFGVDHTTVLHSLNKTGSTNKLVEVLPHMDAARRSKNREGIVVALVEPTPTPPPVTRSEIIERVVKEGYRTGKPKAEIAASAGVKATSVPVIAWRIGIRRKDFAPSAEAAAR